MSTRILVTDIQHGTIVHGVGKKCPWCERVFVGRASAKYCSHSCKNMHFRKSKEQEQDKNSLPQTRARSKQKEKSLPQAPVLQSTSILDISSLEEAPMWFINKRASTYKLLDKYQGWIEKATTQEELDVAVEKFNKKAKKLLRLLKKEV